MTTETAQTQAHKESQTAEALPMAVLRSGFRVFFLGAGVFACGIVPLWILVLKGNVRAPAVFDLALWHAHEMVFGYTVAVIAGFLLTAVPNWTHAETATGARLGFLFTVWALGRVVMNLPVFSSNIITATIDWAFLPLLAFTLARPIISSHNRRNYVMPVVISTLALANALTHASELRWVSADLGRHAVIFAVDVIVFLCAVITGRVVPMFTRNATQKDSIAAPVALERTYLVSLALFALGDLFAPDSLAVAILASIAGVLTLARSARWGVRHTFAKPILWILHLGHLWIALALFLRTASHWGLTGAGTTSLHALTLGVIGTLTLGMMARVGLGHTGRTITASGPTVASFVCIALAVFLRVFGPMVSPAKYLTWITLAGVAWAVAFGLFVWVYAPILTTPRPDEKPT